MKKHLWSLIAFVCLILLTVASATEGANRGVAIKIKNESGKEVTLYGESHALVIGVSAYQAGWPKLPGVVNDVEVVKKLLTRQGFEVVTVLNPNKDKLLKAYDDFIQNYGSNPDNRLLFYYAGHGFTEHKSYGGDIGYIVPADAPVPEKDKAAFAAKAIDMQQIESFAKRIDAKHALFLFDSCFSGSIFDMTRAVPESISYKASRPVRQFITSGAADEPVPDKSIFLEQFKAALEGAAADKDGYVTGTALGEYLQNTVTNYSKGTQHPQYGKIRDSKLDKGDFVFKVKDAVAVATTPAISDSQPAPAENARFEPDGSKQQQSEPEVDSTPDEEATFNPDGLKQQQSEPDGSKAWWASNLREMKRSFIELKSYLETESNVDKKIVAINRFKDTFPKDNPYSTEDNAIIMEINKILERLKNNKTNYNIADENRPKPEPVQRPEDTPPADVPQSIGNALKGFFGIFTNPNAR
ncbi:MAG: caspase family protein [Nitrospirae bacterium]|nr:caspase family protein [Nitrospirota bacterium]